MMGRSHLATGVVAGLGVAAVAPVPGVLVPLVVAVAAVSALIPDADHPSAPIANALPPISWGLCWLLRNVSVRLTGTSHRGWTHSLVFAVLWGGLSGLLAAVWLPVVVAVWTGVSAAVGCAAHVFGDVLTVSGCKHVLWPSRVQVRVPRAVRFRTGGGGERAVLFAVMAGGVALLPVVVR